MVRYFAILAILVLAVFLAPLRGANVKLYLKDGGDQLVREYEVTGDRVRYYSTERGQWEEIPLQLVDLERTRQEQEKDENWRQTRQEEDQILRQAERLARTELHNVPLEDGVYLAGEEMARPLPQSEVTLSSSKTRGLLRVLAPMPIVPGKATANVAGKTAAFAVNDPRPIFYMRLAKNSRSGILRMKEEKDSRQAQVIETMHATEQVMEEQDEVEIFRQQLAPNVYRLWPVEPLAAGEYAVFEYTPGEKDIRIWDFSCCGGESKTVPVQ